MKILITGASGFVGQALLALLQTRPQCHLRAAVRQSAVGRIPHGIEQVVIGDLDAHTDWQAALVGIDVVVHLAARVHILHDRSSNPLESFRRVNVAGSMRLAQMAVQAGVKRLVYMSSAKVHGESTPAGHPFTETSPTLPQDAYGISKLETEQGLHSIAESSGLELCILRPPLVYGAGVRANFETLARAVARGIPLPLGAIANQRSLVGIDNLVDLIAHCLIHPAAANQTFMASDGEDLSTTALIQRMALAMNRSTHLIPIPAWLLTAGASLLGQKSTAQRLCGNLQVDSSKVRKLLNWMPPISVDEGLRQAVAGYRR